MAKVDLNKYGITNVKDIVHNPSYDVLCEQKIAFVTSAHLRTDALKIWSILGSFSIGKTEAAIEFETRMRV